MLVGGLRVLGANTGGAQHGVFTDRPGVLSQDFFVNLLDLGIAVAHVGGRRRTSTRAATRHRRPWCAPPPPSTWCSARTRSCAASSRSTPADDAKEKFVRDFVDAWVKVMELDRFDLR